MLPFSIPVWIVFSSDCSAAGTWPEKSWNGDSTAPPLASGADVGAALERAARRPEHRGLHRGLYALGHAADEVLAVLRRADAAVGVHQSMLTLPPEAVGLLNGLWPRQGPRSRPPGR